MTNDPTNDTADREAIVDALVGNVVYALRDIRFTREQLHALAVAMDDIRIVLTTRPTVDPLDADFDEILVTEERRIIKDRKREAARVVAMTKDKSFDPLVAALDEIMANEPGWTPPTGP
jgi:hypothetical protein